MTVENQADIDGILYTGQVLARVQDALLAVIVTRVAPIIATLGTSH